MKLTTLLCSCLILCVSAFAQTEKIALWNGPAPGTEGRANLEVTDANGNISQVFQPELTYFPAPDQTGPAPAILVCPGGGYRNVVMPKEGTRVALYFQKRGFAVFVLKYRLTPAEAVQDARRAMRTIRQQAAKYHVDPAKIGVTGFSAGGHLSANLALNFAVSDLADATDKISARPDFCAPIYGVLEPLNPANFEPGRSPALYSITSLKDAVANDVPPMFLAHAVDDKTVPVEHSLNLFIALKAKGVPAELHLYEKGGHGFALDPERGYASSWGEAFILWLKAHGVDGKTAKL
jgi:acetyl esterase/lipase